VSDGRQIRIFLVDGTPGGLLTAEIMNWTGHIVAAPRSDLARLLGREETSRTGVYVLLGDDPEVLGQQLAYIGEGDEVRDRLAQHARSEEQGGKDFWDRAIVLTSKDANLTKAHARYLESKFISLATLAGRSRLINATAPPPPPLPEADRSDMEYYITQAKIVLPVLGINLLRASAVSSLAGSAGIASGQPTVASPAFTLHLKKEGRSSCSRSSQRPLEVHPRLRVRQPQRSRSCRYRTKRERPDRVADPGLRHELRGVAAPGHRLRPRYLKRRLSSATGFAFSGHLELLVAEAGDRTERVDRQPSQRHVTESISG
jgi:hypothetical protein